MEKTHWKKLNNPNFLGAYAFQPDEEKTLTISTVGTEVVTGPDGKKETCTVIHWAETEKPMILNTTNARMINKLFQTPYIEDWSGRAVVLGVETVAAFGERVEAVRVKKKQPVVSACADCGQVIQGKGKFTAAQVAAASANRFGRALCVECVEQIKAKEKGQAAAGQAAPEKEGQDGQQ